MTDQIKKALSDEIKSSKALKNGQCLSKHIHLILRWIIISGITITFACILFPVIPYTIIIFWLLPFIPFWYIYEMEGFELSYLSTKYEIPLQELQTLASQILNS